MWSRKKKQVMDERIMKEYNKFAGKMFYVMTFLTIALLVTKLIFRLPIHVYALELISLVASVGYVLVSELKKGILLIREKDDELKAVHQDILTKGMMVSFWIIIFGELLFMLVAGKYFFWTVSYLLIWFFPALAITIAAIKNGWFIWGSKKREQDGKKNFKVRVVIGSLFFGLFVGFPMLFKDGAFQPEGILWILGLGAGWGIPFYLIMVGMMKVSEKRADKNLEEKEKAIEE